MYVRSPSGTTLLWAASIVLAIQSSVSHAQDGASDSLAVAAASIGDRVNTTRGEYKLKKAKESAPLYSFAAWDPWGKICLLLKLDAMFTISYQTRYGKQVCFGPFLFITKLIYLFIANIFTNVHSN